MMKLVVAFGDFAKAP